jgi:hypothetical protein
MVGSEHGTNEMATNSSRKETYGDRTAGSLRNNQQSFRVETNPEEGAEKRILGRLV